MKRIQDILDQKATREIFTIDPDETLFGAVVKMVEHNVGALLVTSQDRLVGIVTERDYLRFVCAQGRTARETPVREIMTRTVIYVTPSSTVDEAMAIMTEKRIRHLPVLKDGALQGVVSIGDAVKQHAILREFQIRTLQEYIADVYPGPSSAAL
jgi:CBS domain-containing protein